jgi:tRNA-dihydrouridine synthase B
MTSANPKLLETRKSRLRRDHDGESAPIGVQIAGSDPAELAAAARYNVEHGAQIVDINMGCPAKKVCKRWAGSALLEDERLVGRILETVVAAVEVPVTLKIRTGWRRDRVNGLTIARIAESAGIAALAVHGRTRDMLYGGEAEYDTIAAIKQAVAIPVLANGDVESPDKAAAVLAKSGADGLMIGRAAQGRPWIFREISHYLHTGERLSAPPAHEVGRVLVEHLQALHAFYGEQQGVRIARKHIGWYAKQADAVVFRARVNRIESAQEQLDVVRDHFAARAHGARAA